MFGTTLGILVTSGLLRFGPSFENTAWSSLFLLAPLGCVYYPLSILPEWLQVISKFLPLVYVFEEARSILINNSVDIENIINALDKSKSIPEKYLSLNWKVLTLEKMQNS